MVMTRTWGSFGAQLPSAVRPTPTLVQAVFGLAPRQSQPPPERQRARIDPAPAPDIVTLRKKEGAGATGTGAGSSEALPGGSYPTSAWRAVSSRLAQQGRRVQ